MKSVTSIARSVVVGGLLALAVLIVPQAVQAQWRVTVGAQSSDWSRIALAFLPNELWVHVGDSITWTFASDEPHTVSFLTADQLVSLPAQASNGSTPDGSSFDGTVFVNSGEMTFGQTYSVKFPTAGNFRLTCLGHRDMRGAVHVLNPSETLPYVQAAYDVQADNARGVLLADLDNKEFNLLSARSPSLSNKVTAGIGEIVTTGQGSQSVSLVRFLPATTLIRAGDTVEWTNLDFEGHTITFGIEPDATRFPLPVVDSGVGVNSKLDSDGALHAIVGSPDDNVHSGTIQPLPQDRVLNAPGVAPTLSRLPQFPLAAGPRDPNQRFRVTFTHPGDYNYKCALHDNLGMLGHVIVLP